MTTINFEMDSRGVARLTLNRPEVKNAMNPEMISDVVRTLSELSDDCRVLVIAAAGNVFCAGADLKWMGQAAMGGTTEDSAILRGLFTAVDQCKVPVVARVQGPAIAGATGLLACCDVVVAAASAVFAFTEVRIGLVPAVISPYVLRKTGYSFARAMFMTGERFDAERAVQGGLVHFAVPDEQLDTKVEEVVSNLVGGAPDALLEARRLLSKVVGRGPEEVADMTVEVLTQRRGSDEAKEGIAAFLEKRKPRWVRE
ncbi:MAG TPA: enoyl-CoA hydratase-related protein [Actinomycetota bacterium]|nr:enoyl-CoA hydratase-related protein [Actinomycetota bacterium]